MIMVLCHTSRSLNFVLFFSNSTSKISIQMYRELCFTVTGICICCLLSVSAFAQQGSAMMTDISKVLVDTSYVLATEVTFKPGYRTEMHTHPAHFFYALTDGSLRVEYENGQVVEYAFKAGENGFSMPEGPHVAINTGKKQIRFVLVELKEHPYKPGM